MKITESIGECPHCGDELFVIKTIAHKRYAKCVNPECEKQTFVPLPHAGHIHKTGIQCPKYHLQLLAFVPILALPDGRVIEQTEKAYFWVNRPCANCTEMRKCGALSEGKNNIHPK